MNPRISGVLGDQVLPRLRSSVPHSVRCVGCEDPQELIQDGTAMAAKMLINAEANGKTVTAGNIAYYTIQHLKSGRRSTGSSCADVLGTGTQLNGRASVGSMEEEVAMDYSFDAPLTFHDLISVDSDDPAVKAMRKLDWEMFMAGLDQQARTLIEWIGEGRTLTSLADHWRVSVTRLLQHKEKLVSKMREYFGEDLWMTLAEQPKWKSNLLAMRQWMACRHERMPLDNDTASAWLAPVCQSTS